MAYSIDLTGQVALITGGARGIGGACTEYFAHAGADTYITGRRSMEEVAPFLDEVEQKFGKRPHYVVCDMADEEEVGRLAEDCVKTFGRLDILINNAGGGKGDYDYMYKVHMKNVALLTETCAPYLAKSEEGGRIVIIGSSTTLYGGRGASVEYVSTKAGEMAMVRVYARKYAKDRIRVNGIYPSAIMAWSFSTSKGTKEETYAYYEKQMPLGVVGEPKDIASLALFLCCEMSSYLDGQHYLVDGGRFHLG